MTGEAPQEAEPCWACGGDWEGCRHAWVEDGRGRIVLGVAPETHDPAPLDLTEEEAAAFVSAMQSQGRLLPPETHDSGGDHV